MGETESDEPLEGTFAMIKPDAVDRASLIFTRIVKEGFLVIEQQRFRFSRELAELFYAEHKNKDFYEELMDYITSGPVIGMVLARTDGINHWRKVLGPTKVSEARKKSPNSIRALYGDLSNDMLNACHGSDSPPNAEREIEIIFPHILHDDEATSSDVYVDQRPGTAESAMVNGHSVPIRETKFLFEGEDEQNVAVAARTEMKRSVVKIENLDNKAYLQKYVVPTLLQGLSEMYEVRPQSPIEWLADWLEENNPSK